MGFHELNTENFLAICPVQVSQHMVSLTQFKNMNLVPVESSAHCLLHPSLRSTKLAGEALVYSRDGLS